MSDTTDLTTSTQGWVYFVGEAGADDYVKVGVTHQKDPKKRRDNLQTGNPRPLDILALCRVEDAYAVETTFHRLFKPDCASGEWFHRTPEINAFIAALQAAGHQAPENDLDAESPTPAYEQLAAILRGQIADGTVTGALPALRALQETYSLGEFAVSHALRVLADEGLIFSVPRRGWYVRSDG